MVGRKNVRRKTRTRKIGARKSGARKAAARRTGARKVGARKTAARKMVTRKSVQQGDAGGKAKRSLGISKNAERVVVDEIMENGRARILRAPRLPGFPDSDLSMTTWGDEIEDAISVWKLEAYVGFKVPRRLQEGDVFFIRDGSNLNEDYAGPKVLKRETAARRHLIEAADDSREQARKEIKERFYNLTAQRVGRDKRDRLNLSKIIRLRVWKGKR